MSNPCQVDSEMSPFFVIFSSHATINEIYPSVLQIKKTGYDNRYSVISGHCSNRSACILFIYSASIRIRIQIVALLVTRDHIDILSFDIIQHILGELTCRHTRMIPGELAEILRILLIIENVSVSGVDLVDHKSYLSCRSAFQFRLTEKPRAAVRHDHAV